jgi:hypothetical protein
MSEQIQSQIISRRKVLFLVGLAASLAAPVTVLTASDARAQQPADQATPGEKKVKKKDKATPAGTAPSGTAPPTTQPKAQ